MKISAHFFVLITTVILALVAVLVFYNFSFPLILITVILGQAWWLLTVYKVLKDDYSTEKTFEDWYEDHPIDNREK
ncbi:hypothetical protein [Salinimicrobium oceani]|uniref:Uncharacterized protein n=1 Tax=Salinimicrobium oceani TaxID=2722702 RepID=A0ABX1CZM9_9FLAO|nr:hypothetical protein [Salinimicrobium oceani]NJW52374.1 hypothetical protein [Salinimicrobium oceani]